MGRYILMKKYSLTGNVKKGFTLLEVIIAMVITSIGLVIIATSMPHVKKVSDGQIAKDRQSFEHFKSILENPQLDLAYVNWKNHQLELYSNEAKEKYQFDLYNQKIIRMKKRDGNGNYSGYMPLLLDVQKFECNYNQLTNELIIEIQLHDRKYRERYVMQEKK